MRRAKPTRDEPPLRRPSVAAAVEKAVQETPVTDAQTELREPAIAEHRRAGIDDLLGDRELVTECLRTTRMAPERFWHLTAGRRSELVWRHLFVERTPLSAGAVEVLATLRGLGLEPRRDELPKLRRWFAERRPDWLVDRVLEVSRVETVVAVSDPFDAAERRRWEKGFARDSRFRLALCLDSLIRDWPAAARQLAEQGFRVSLDFGRDTEGEVRRFLDDWSRRVEPIYVSVSLPPAFRFPHSGPAARLLERVILPHCAAIDRPLACSVSEQGDTSSSPPAASRSSTAVEIASFRRLCSVSGANRFLASAPASPGEHELTLLARAFPRLHPIGCGAVSRSSVSALDDVRERLALLGTSFTPFSSGARALDHLISRWERARHSLKIVLQERYEEIAQSGWVVTRAEIQQTVRALLGGAFKSFSGPSA